MGCSCAARFGWRGCEEWGAGLRGAFFWVPFRGVWLSRRTGPRGAGRMQAHRLAAAPNIVCKEGLTRVCLVCTSAA